VARKNPLLALDCFAATLARRPESNLHLVLKAQHAHLGAELMRQLRQQAAAFEGRVTVLEGTLGDSDAKALIACCDCFLSLHRSEGFGRGPAEAMFLGKPVIATGWSGNMEYMTADTSFPVACDLVEVAPGEFPFGEGQVWAQPRVAAAVEALVRLIDDPSLGVQMGARAAEHMQRHFSNAVLGPKYIARFREIAAGPVRAGGGPEARPSGQFGGGG
jgi:glycosyltransferase involved in cell wall biosynthesis